MRRLVRVTLPLLALLSTSAALASTTTYNVAFTGSGGVAASRSYTITFDPTMPYTNATAGITVNSFSDTFAPPTNTAFNYYLGGSGTLLIGGLLNGVDTVSYGTDDYFVGINEFTQPIRGTGLGPSDLSLQATGTSATIRNCNRHQPFRRDSGTRHLAPHVYWHTWHLRSRPAPPPLLKSAAKAIWPIAF